MTIYTFYGLLTLVLFLLFLGIVFWAYSGRRKDYFEEAASLPLEENDGDSDNSRRKGQGT